MLYEGNPDKLHHSLFYCLKLSRTQTIMTHPSNTFFQKFCCFWKDEHQVIISTAKFWKDSVHFSYKVFKKSAPIYYTLQSFRWNLKLEQMKPETWTDETWNLNRWNLKLEQMKPETWTDETLKLELTPASLRHLRHLQFFLKTAFYYLRDVNNDQKTSIIPFHPIPRSRRNLQRYFPVGFEVQDLWT